MTTKHCFSFIYDGYCDGWLLYAKLYYKWILIVFILFYWFFFVSISLHHKMCSISVSRLIQLSPKKGAKFDRIMQKNEIIMNSGFQLFSVRISFVYCTIFCLARIEDNEKITFVFMPNMRIFFLNFKCAQKKRMFRNLHVHIITI